MKQFFLHPLFRIFLIVAIITSLLFSCEYGPKHGNIHKMKDRPASMQQPISMGGTEDFTEGTTAFLEKRKPNFPGK